MGMFNFLKKKEPVPPKAPGQPAFEMPDIKFEFPQAGMDAPPLPSAPKGFQPPMPFQQTQPAQRPEPQFEPFQQQEGSQTEWSFDDKQEEKFPLPPDKSFDEMAPIKPLKNDDYSFEAPQTEDPFKPDEEPGAEPPGLDEDMLQYSEPDKPVRSPYQPTQFKPAPFKPFQPVELEQAEEPERPIPQDHMLVTGPGHRMINGELFINVDAFREITGLVNSLQDETHVSEEGLLRIKDIALNRERVYDKWQGDLEQIEKELIQLDKLVFKM